MLAIAARRLLPRRVVGHVRTNYSYIYNHSLRQALRHAMETREVIATDPEMLLDLGRRYGPPQETGRVAFHTPLGDTVKYRALDAMANGVAHKLSELGCGKGTRVAVMHSRAPFIAAAYFGTWYSGATAVALHPDHPKVMLEHQLKQSEAKAILVCPRTRAYAEQVVERMETKPTILTVPNDTRLREHFEFVDVTGFDEALILYKSSDAGKPVGVVHMFGGLEWNLRYIAERWMWRDDDRLLHVLSLHHIHGLVYGLLAPLYVGASIEFASPSQADAIWKRLLSGKITAFQAIPTIYAHLLRHTPRDIDADEIRQRLIPLVLTTVGGGVCPLSVSQEWHRVTGNLLLERFCTAETGICVAPHVALRTTSGFVGTALKDVDAWITQPHSTVRVRRGDTGELRIRSWGMFKGYDKDLDATLAVYDPVKEIFKTRMCAHEVQFPDGHWEIQILGPLSETLKPDTKEPSLERAIEAYLMHHKRVAAATVLSIIPSSSRASSNSSGKESGQTQPVLVAAVVKADDAFYTEGDETDPNRYNVEFDTPQARAQDAATAAAPSVGAALAAYTQERFGVDHSPAAFFFFNSDFPRCPKTGQIARDELEKDLTKRLEKQLRKQQEEDEEDKTNQKA